MSDGIVFLNGEFLPAGEARVSVLDRGFIFGDGVYEVIPVYGKRLFRLASHLRRLQFSLDGIRLPNPYSENQWAEHMAALIAEHPWDAQALYLQVTRGVAKRDFGLLQGMTPTVFMMTNALSLPTREQLEAGVAAVTTSDMRWLHCHIKSISLLGSNMARQVALDAGAAEVVQLRAGYLSEGSASNIFVVRNGTLLAPPRDHLILAGITYEVLLELAEQNGMPCEIREVSEQEVLNADELMLSSTTREVLAITTLNGRPVGNGEVGPVFKRLHGLFQACKEAFCTSPSLEAL